MNRSRRSVGWWPGDACEDRRVVGEEMTGDVGMYVFKDNERTGIVLAPYVSSFDGLARLGRRAMGDLDSVTVEGIMN